jgi:glycosyltransferase involved in cell wall biosynthesis
MMEMTAAVAIPTYKRPEYLLDALRSVIAQETDFAFETLVVDNGCDDGLAASVEEIGRQASMPVRYIPVEEIGLHHCRHAAAFAARGEVIVYIDDDVIAPPGWLAAMLAPYADPMVACVGGKTMPLWEAEPPGWIEQFGPNGGTYLSLLDLGDEVIELHWPAGVYGCNMSVRRAALFAVGGFNPDGIGDRRRIWLRGDGETGLHRKLYEMDCKVIYSPYAWLYHRVPASRLTPSYFNWRAYLQGMSDSYSDTRDRKLTPLRRFRHIARCFLRSGRLRLAAWREHDPSRAIVHRARSAYWQGRASHQLRLSVSPGLRSYVLRNTYLE